MSWLSSTAGGALVHPPLQGSSIALFRKRISFRLKKSVLHKSLGFIGYTKDGGPCKQGQNPERDGCITASHEGGSHERTGTTTELGKPLSNEASPPKKETPDNQQSRLARISAKFNAIANKIPVVGKVKQSISKVMKGIHSRLEKRYSSKVATVIMTSGAMGGYGVAGAAFMLTGIPGIPVVNDLVSIAAHTAIAELGLQLRRLSGKTMDEGNADFIEEQSRLVADEIKKALLQLIREHREELSAALQDTGNRKLASDLVHEYRPMATRLPASRLGRKSFAYCSKEEGTAPTLISRLPDKNAFGNTFRLKDSFFSTCDRDDEGHCKPGTGSGGSNDNKPAPGQHKPQDSKAVEKLDKNLRKQAKEWNKKLRPKERNAIKDYVRPDAHETRGTNFRGLNEKLRKCPGLSCLDDDERKWFDGIENAIQKSKPLKEPIKVYRGIAIKEADLDGIIEKFVGAAKAGDSVSLDGIVSTSISQDRALEYATQKRGSILFEIEAHHGAYVQPFTDDLKDSEQDEWSQNQEFVMSHGTECHVTGVVRRTKMGTIDFGEGPQEFKRIYYVVKLKQMRLEE